MRRVREGELRERLRSVPGMERLLPALDGLAPAYLVGGAVRDLLRGAAAVDLDVAVEGDARAVARALADRLRGVAREHERFGTATVRADGLTVDLATTRRETYPEPGALPDVEEAELDEDLARRDFTINAMALGLSGDDLGHLYDPRSGVPDLEEGIVRVLHDGSFVDDPTRLLRALRYEARLGFRMAPDTEGLAGDAAAEGGLRAVSGARVRDELMDLLAEPELPSAVVRMRELGIDRAMHTAMEADAELVASAALGAVALGADRALVALAALCAPAAERLDLWVGDLHLPAWERDAVTRAARVAPRLARQLREREHIPSELRRLLGRETLVALSLALAMGAPSEPILRWVSELQLVQLDISGADLLAHGVPEGPAIGRALEETLSRKLDGVVRSREEELETALMLARETGHE